MKLKSLKKHKREAKMQDTKINWVKVKNLFKVILTSSIELFGVFAIYFVNLARAMQTKTYGSSDSLSNKSSGSINSKQKHSFNLFSNFNKNIIASFLILIAMLGAFASISNAADPGHGANVIGSGTFEIGDYRFPQNLHI